MLDIRRDFPEVAWRDLVDMVRDRGGPMLRPVVDAELAPARRISPRHSTGAPVDPLSVLLVLHQNRDWTERYYESLINGRFALDAHNAFNMHAAAIVEGLRDGKIQPPVVQPAKRPSADTLRQLHSCWRIGASNLVKLLDRVMQNAGAVFPEDQRLPGSAPSFEKLMIEHCPERILLSHCQGLLRRLAALPVVLRGRRAANAAPRPDQENVAANNPRPNRPLAVRAPAAHIGAVENRVAVVPLHDDPPPPYEAVGQARRLPMPLDLEIWRTI